MGDCVGEGSHCPEFFVREVLVLGVESARGAPELEGGSALEHVLLGPCLFFNLQFPFFVESLLLSPELLLQFPQSHFVDRVDVLYFG